MKRTLSLMKGAVLLFVLVLAAGHVAGEPAGEKAAPSPPADPAAAQSEAPPVVEIDAVTSATTRYLPVRFNHQGHAELYDIQCKGCHTEEPHGDLRVYYHRLCLGCHLAGQEEDTKEPPDCFVCHTERP